MRSVPRFLPGANSRKWHSRRVWDPLGYLRVRTLANPNWERDVPWLTGVMDRSRPQEPGLERERFDLSFAALRRYRAATNQGDAQQLEQLWDAYLEALDGYLELVQARHLRAVDEAGVSGRPQVDRL